MNESSHSSNTHQREKVWSDIHDAMLLRAPHRFKLHIRAKIKKNMVSNKIKKTFKHFSLLIDMTEKLSSLAPHWRCSRLKIYQAAQVAMISLFSAPLLIPLNTLFKT